MTLDQLLILDKIVEVGSISAAAKALHRTQPTLSVSMKKLEEELELEIFARDNYRTTLTPVGKAIHQKAKRVLERAEELENFGRQLALGNEPEVNIAFEASIPICFISKILKKSERDFPETNLNLVAENLTGSIEQLMDGKVDLAVIPWFKDNHLLETLPFIKCRLFPVAASSYPPAQYKGEVPLEEMREYVQVILKDSAKNPTKGNYGVIEGARHWIVNNHHTKKDIILEGLGWGSIPEYTIQKELESKKLIPLKIENYYRYQEMEVRVARKVNQPIGPVAQSLWESFQKSTICNVQWSEYLD